MFPTTKPLTWVSSYHPPLLLCVSFLCSVDTILIEPLDIWNSTSPGKYVHMYVHRVIKHMRTFPSILINNARNVAEGGIQIPVTVSGALLLLPSSPTNHRKGHTEEGLFLIRMRSSVVVVGQKDIKNGSAKQYCQQTTTTGTAKLATGNEFGSGSFNGFVFAPPPLTCPYSQALYLSLCPSSACKSWSE